MTDNDAQQSGGVGHIQGYTVHAVTDASGPVNTGSGPQYNVQSAVFAAEYVSRPRRSPRLIAEDVLRELARRFAAPPGFQRLRHRLDEVRTLLLTGRSGNGRRTAAMMLLHGSGDGSGQYRELPDDLGEAPALLLDPTAIEPGERLLLDLSGELARQFSDARRQLVEYHSAVLSAGAYLVVVLPENVDHEVPGELRHLVARVERPAGARVLGRHLVAAGVVESESELDASINVPSLAPHLQSDPMHEVARLARLICETRDAAEGQGTVREWLVQAVAAMSAPLDEVSTQFRGNTDGRFRALLLASAMFEKTTAEVVFHAADLLLTTVGFPDDPIHRLERPDFAECLRAIDASTDSERRVRLRTVTHGSAVRTYFWNCFPGLRDDLSNWLDKALRLKLDHRDRVAVLRRFGAQCLRTGHADDLFQLIRKWNKDGATAGLLVAASDVLAQGLTDDRYSAMFRRQLYTWSTDRNLGRGLALQLVLLCAEAIAPTRPDQALVRLRHLTRNTDPEVSAAARRTLVDLAAEDVHFLRRVVHRLADDLSQPRPKPTDVALFTAVTDPFRLTAGTPPPLSDRWLRSLLARAWQGLMLNLPTRIWAATAQQWLQVAANGPDSLLDVLVAGAAGRADLNARLYLVARDWVVGDATRRPTAAELLRRCDQAEGLDLRGNPRTNASEGAVR